MQLHLRPPISIVCFYTNWKIMMAMMLCRQHLQQRAILQADMMAAPTHSALCLYLLYVLTVSQRYVLTVVAWCISREKRHGGKCHRILPFPDLHTDLTNFAVGTFSVTLWLTPARSNTATTVPLGPAQPGPTTKSVIIYVPGAVRFATVNLTHRLVSRDMWLLNIR